MSYGRTAPEGIPQDIWDRAIAVWLDDDSTVDSARIMRIAKRMMLESEPPGPPCPPAPPPRQFG